MSPTRKKTSVSSEKALDWLERNERGESPPVIAQVDGYDPRTVRKYLEIARQERESKEARGSVLRNALERHYADLCRYAERLTVRSSGGHAGESGESMSRTVQYEPQLGAALREHLPRSPIWTYLKRIEKLNMDKAELNGRLRSVIESSIASDSDLSRLTTEESVAVPMLIDAMKSQVEGWLQGLPGLNIADNLNVDSVENGFTNIHYGHFNLGRVREEHVDLVRRAITDWTASVKQMEEYLNVERTVREIEGVEKKLNDEIAVIVLRRVIPGRCKYCPL